MTPSRKAQFASVLLALTTQLVSCFITPYAQAQGPVAIPAGPHAGAVRPHVRTRPGAAIRGKKIHHYPGSVRIKSKKLSKKQAKKSGPPPKPPQELVGSLSEHTLAPGVVHKVHRGPMYINLLDVDLSKANVMVKPVLAGESFNKLDEVRDQAQKVQAIAAINGNYFKRDGTPLGTLIIDGEWIAGPLFDRTCMGITRDGRVLVDRVTLHGTLLTSNPDAPQIWVNNINQPRRHGAHLIAYTRRWGDSVKMAYEGTLLAVDYNGRIVARGGKQMYIPAGGYVLSDSKDSEIAKLNVGDLVKLTWQPGPSDWSNVIEAVSGGPVLIRDGKLFVDCKDEKFCKSWTGNQIHARTAVGVTANRHLLLATIEGPHTLWDVAKFLKKLGAVDAMNLDGGGSTTMVIDGKTVTKNSSTFERRVASALAVLPHSASVDEFAGATQYTPQQDFSQFGIQTYGSAGGSTQPQYAAQSGGQYQVPAQQYASQYGAQYAGQYGSQYGATQQPVYGYPGYELTQTQPAVIQRPDVLQGQSAPRRYGNAGNQDQDSEKPTKVGRVFGWMKHLNPLK